MPHHQVVYPIAMQPQTGSINLNSPPNMSPNPYMFEDLERVSLNILLT